jgi:tetratricopeptide (TPR) repeat protein
MPRKGVAGIPHSDDTSHRIVRRAGQPYPESAFGQSDPDLPGLVCVNRRGDARTRPIPLLTRLLAYNDLMVGKRFPEATRYYLEALKQLRREGSEEPVVLACLGRKALFDKDYEDAVRYLTRAADKGADYDSVYLDLSEALARLGRVEESAEVLERGVAAWPFSAEIHQALVLRYMSLDRPRQAREALKRYVTLFPEDAIGREALAQAAEDAP